MSQIVLSGKFDVSDALNWLQACVNDVPQAEAETNIYYKSTLLSTYFALKISDGSIQIRSDNFSTLAILKDSVMTEASNRKVAITLSEPELDFTSIGRVLDILHPLVQEQYDVASRYQLIDALKEVVAGEEDTSFLSEEYREILKDAEAIKKRFEDQPRRLGYLWSVIADLFGDTSKIKGRHNVGDQLR